MAYGSHDMAQEIEELRAENKRLLEALEADPAIHEWQVSFIEGLEYALNLTHLPMEDLVSILKGKIDEIEADL